MVGGSPVEYLREACLCPLLVPEHLLEAGRGEHEVAQAEDAGTGLQHQAGAVTLDLDIIRIII